MTTGTVWNSTLCAMMIGAMMLAAARPVPAQAQATAPIEAPTSAPTTTAPTIELAKPGLSATAPATAPARSVLDLSSPRAAAKALQRAVDDGDLEALRHLIHGADESHHRLADAYAAAVVAGTRLAHAMREQFGPAGAVGAGPDAIDQVDVAAIDAAPLRISGNTATMQLPGRGERPLSFRRDPAGRWRVDLLAFANVSDVDVANQCEMQLNLAAALSELATEISTGRYRTAADARAAVQDRVHGAIAKSLRSATHPATSPTTQPAATSAAAAATTSPNQP